MSLDDEKKLNLEGFYIKKEQKRRIFSLNKYWHSHLGENYTDVLQYGYTLPFFKINAKTDVSNLKAEVS